MKVQYESRTPALIGMCSQCSPTSHRRRLGSGCSRLALGPYENDTRLSVAKTGPIAITHHQEDYNVLTSVLLFSELAKVESQNVKSM